MKVGRRQHSLCWPFVPRDEGLRVWPWSVVPELGPGGSRGWASPSRSLSWGHQAGRGLLLPEWSGGCVTQPHSRALAAADPSSRSQHTASFGTVNLWSCHQLIFLCYFSPCPCLQISYGFLSQASCFDSLLTFTSKCQEQLCSGRRILFGLNERMSSGFSPPAFFGFTWEFILETV